MKKLEGFASFIRSLSPVRLVALGYLSYVLAGWLALSLPFMQRGAGVPSLDNLFVSVSAVSTTGLCPVSVSQDYSFLGQLVVLILIQLGGLGYMTAGSFVVLARTGAMSDLRAGVLNNVFSLPDNFRIDKFIRSVVKFTLAVELAGAVALFMVFRAAGAPIPLWNSIFHSVSAFCTAGFSLFDTSLESYAHNFWLNAIVSVLSILGAVGFIVFVDVWRRLRGKIPHITFTSKIILCTSFWLLVAGTVILAATEPQVQSLPPHRRIVVSFFQAMTAMTTVGFNSVPIGAIARSSLVLLTILMIIGASPAGTGGGIKSTTFTAMVGVVRGALRGETKVTFLGREIPERRVRSAMANVWFYLFALAAGIFALSLTEPASLQDITFEAASALGTVGLSTGITSSLTCLGKILIIALMFVDRLGPLTFALAFSGFRAPAELKPEDVAI